MGVDWHEDDIKTVMRNIINEINYQDQQAGYYGKKNESLNESMSSTGSNRQ